VGMLVPGDGLNDNPNGQVPDEPGTLSTRKVFSERVQAQTRSLLTGGQPVFVHAEQEDNVGVGFVRHGRHGTQPPTR